MSTVFTFPGKIGDALLQWPVAYHWSKQNKELFSAWMDENTLKCLSNLFSNQPCVESVDLRGGISDYRCGGQPFDFGLTTKDHVENQIFHLGFRGFPSRQITLQTKLDVPFHLSTDPEVFANEPSIVVREPIYGNRCVLHGTFIHHHGGGVPGFWRFLNRIHAELEERFEEITFVGPAADRKRALELYPDWKEFDDGGDFHELARLVGGSRLVIGAGSSVAALGGAMKVPTIRVHDPIGEYPKYIWSNLGRNQINDTELELRKSWPRFRDEILAPKIVGV